MTKYEGLIQREGLDFQSGYHLKVLAVAACQYSSMLQRGRGD